MKRIIITGTGRAGTTFLMKLFTLLDLDTGFNKENVDEFIDNISHGGLEFSLSKHIPHKYIKNPAIMDCFDDFIKDYDVEKIIIPIRDIKEVADNRAEISKKSSTGWGGLWGTDNPLKQKEILEQKLLKFLLDASKYHIPIVFISFEKMFSDKEYLYKKLDIGVPKSKFNKVFDLIVV